MLSLAMIKARDGRFFVGTLSDRTFSTEIILETTRDSRRNPAEISFETKNSRSRTSPSLRTFGFRGFPRSRFFPLSRCTRDRSRALVARSPDISKRNRVLSLSLRGRVEKKVGRLVERPLKYPSLADFGRNPSFPFFSHFNCR